LLATGVGSTCPSLDVDWDAKTARYTSCATPEGHQETSELISGFLPYFNFIEAERKATRAVWNSEHTLLLKEALIDPGERK